MRLKYTLALGMLIAASAANAQDWINDTISTEAGYIKNVYYGLEKGTAAKVDADNWDIGFSTSSFSASIITNSADRSIRLYALAADTAKFGTDLKADLAAAITDKPMSLYNSNLTWEDGAFNNATGAAYGWGDYNSTTHWIEGRKIFGLITKTDTFQIFVQVKQTYQVENAPVYYFKVAKIDGTGSTSKVLTVGGSSYEGKNFAYYSIEKGDFVDREPLSADWDFVFSNYNDADVIADNVQYKVFGVINNEKLKVAVVKDASRDEFDDLDYKDYTAYDTVNNSIGRAWKSSGMGGVKMTDSLCYFIKVANGDIWQLAFTHHISGTAEDQPGLVALKKRKVYEEPVSVAKVNANVESLVVAPNPAVAGQTNLFIDAKQGADNAQIVITDLSGRTIYKSGLDIRTGFQQIPLHVAQYPAGLYIVNVSGQGFNVSQKLVVR